MISERPAVSRPYAARILRVVVDLVVLSLSFAAGIAVDYWFRSSREVVAPTYIDALDGYLPALPLLLVISVGYFALAGFYSRQRTYRGRHKAAAVVQATLLSFLTYGAIAYALRAYVLFPPAAAIAVSGAFAMAALLALRLYAFAWKGFARSIVEAADPESVNRGTVEVREQREVLVIGGAGYIGSALVPQLLESGVHVRLLDRFLFGREPIAAFVNHPNLTIQDADFRRTDQLVIAMRNAETVIHLGGIVGDPACALDENLTIELNVAANRSVAEIARAQQVRRFIFASSCSVYGANDEVLDEHSQVRPVSLYAESKVASETVLRQQADHVLRPTILRLGTVYGLSGRTRFDLVVNLLTAKALVDGLIPVIGPDQWRPFVHVSDAAAAFALAASTPSAIVENRTFNVGSNDQNQTLGALGHAIAARVPGSQVVETDMVDDRRNYRVSFDRIDKELGFRSQWSIEQGIDQIVAALSSGQIEDYTRDEYSNVAWFRQLLQRDHLAPDGQLLRLSESAQLDFAQDSSPAHGAG